MKITPNMIDAGQNAYGCQQWEYGVDDEDMRLIIQALAPLVLEEAAKVVDALAADEYEFIPDARGALANAAEVIRALDASKK